MFKKRCSATLLLLVLSLLLAGCGGGNMSGLFTAPAPREPFTIIVIPDTQYYSNGWPALLTTMTQWIADSKTAMNIAFVLQEGDLTHTNTTAEWSNVSASFAVLDGAVPYAVCPGNHDTPTVLFNTYFPVSRFESRPYFGGVFETGKIDNAYYLFTAGGADWLVIVLEYNPRDEALDWADGVAAANPRRRAIVLTHAYLTPSSTLGSIGTKIWDNLVRLHPNISFVFNGHYTDGVTGRLVSAGDNGNNVYQMFFNYQTYSFGGGGRLRIVEFDPDHEKVSVKTFSPWMNFYETEPPDSPFEFNGVALGNP